MPKVSVIMSTFNSKEEHLRSSIESILNQSYKDIELIIVNDGSQFKDIEIIKSYDDNRIVLINNEKNIGLAASLNKAIKMSRGEYIARMDSDDVSLKRRIEKQVKFMEKNPHIDIVGTYARFFGDSKKVSLTPLINMREIYIMLLMETTLLHPTVMIRKSFIEQNELLYNELFTYAQDFDMWARCSELGNIEIMPEILVYIRKHAKQISTEKKNLQKKFAKKILKRQLDNFGVDYSDREFELHLMLSGLCEFDIEKILDLKRWINKLNHQNELVNKYNKKIFQKILTNKVFNIYFKLPKNKLKLIFDAILNKDLRFFIFNNYNFKVGFKRLICILKTKLYEILEP